MIASVQLKQPFIDFITKLFTRGTAAFLIIYGRRETGKSDFALLIAEILHDSGLIKHFSTNMKIYESPFSIEHITDLQTLKFWSKNHQGRKLFLFDEYGKAMRRRSPMSSLNIKLIDRLQVLRKDKTSTVAITVNEKYVDNASLGTDILDGYFLKPNYKNKKLALYYDLLENYTKTLRGIPSTSIHFDEWDVAPFKEFDRDRKPKFKDKERDLLWDYSHGATYKDLDIHPWQMARLLRKFVKEVLERETTHYTSS